MTAPFAVRAIDLTFLIGSGPYGDGPQTTVKHSGLRVQTEITCAGQPGASVAQLRVYGLALSEINQLSTLGLHHYMRHNVVTISAGDAVSGMGVVFQGIIIDAYADFGSPPEMALVVLENSVLDLQVKPVPPSSYAGAADVVVVLSAMAKRAGLVLENNGVVGVLSNPYFPGTTMDQIRSCAKAANINVYVDRPAGVLAIWPRGGSRAAGGPVKISAQTGMIGYPAYQRAGVVVRSLFNPLVKYGGDIAIESAITPACGTWHVFGGITYALESQLPDGAWEMSITAFRQGTEAPGRAPVQL